MNLVNLFSTAFTSVSQPTAVEINELIIQVWVAADSILKDKLDEIFHKLIGRNLSDMIHDVAPEQ